MIEHCVTFENKLALGAIMLCFEFNKLMYGTC